MNNSITSIVEPQDNQLPCMHCSRAIVGTPIAVGQGHLHGECLPAGLLGEALVAVTEMVAVVAAPVIVVWAG